MGPVFNQFKTFSINLSELVFTKAMSEAQILYNIPLNNLLANLSTLEILSVLKLPTSVKPVQLSSYNYKTFRLLLKFDQIATHLRKCMSAPFFISGVGSWLFPKTAAGQPLMSQYMACPRPQGGVSWVQ